MRETLNCLSHLDHVDTEKQMMKKLSTQLSGWDWTWSTLNTFCWVIRSVSGSVMEEQMLKKLSKQLSGEDCTWNTLNTLCWAIRSISGSMMEERMIRGGDPKSIFIENGFREFELRILLPLAGRPMVHHPISACKRVSFFASHYFCVYVITDR
ncbi:uncharacterized protein LOC119991349 isoform X2 [Tripterygium wilfordii]|uniref:uncharacterized protein LOC119991349 isoform X2 n=1 Tax=Tripterygium wilfordii TaxID=458696 RepID=UPI0018F82CB3|nr:uncharacterized protein LOC119991349 isoform X2 [Tripterygium wilfordii]